MHRAPRRLRPGSERMQGRRSVERPALLDALVAPRPSFVSAQGCDEAEGTSMLTG